ncbi:MAG: GAF domain-containing protein, partial [Acetobacterales bacterium]
MPDSAVAGAESIEKATDAAAGLTAGVLLRRLIMLYVWGSAAAVVITFFLVLVGLEFTPEQWLGLFLITPFAVLFYVLSDIYVIVRHFRPIAKVLSSLEKGVVPPQEEVSPAIARALNLPFYSFIRVTFLHGPGAALAVLVGLLTADAFMDVDYETWQVAGFVLTVLFFASPTHAIFEYFGIARLLGPVYVKLWRLCPSLREEDREKLISINLKEKLLYLAIFVTTLPLLFFAISILFKTGLLLDNLGIEDPLARLGPLLHWVGGVVAVCMLGALTMSVLTASEVSRSAMRMLDTMREVQQGRLDRRLSIISTDEYMDLYRGFNLMTESLREEVRILEVSQDLAGELNLDRLIARIMTAATELLGAERSTLFVYDRKTGELWSRFAEGLASSEIRIPTDQGIAGAVFTDGGLLNIDDAYNHPLFNPAVDRRTGFRTRSILCMSIVNKVGERIGVTQVLNKRGGPFTAKDEARLRAFTAQVGVTLENAQLFDDVLNMKNYNEGILRSTTNGIVTLDADNRVVRANDAAVKLLHTTLEAIVDQPVEAVVGEGNQWILRSLENVWRTGENDLSVDTVLVFPNGESSSCNLTVAPLKGIDDESMGSMIIIEDISSEKRVRATMARYMSKEVADQLLAAGESELGGKNQLVTILFSDIRSFTSISEAMGARETVSMLNEYFEEMVDVVLSNGGILDKYIGDSIMALFGAPFAGEHDADHAVKVANG